MNKSLSLLISSSALISLPSSAAVLVAGWDNFDNPTNPTATDTGLGTTATLTSSATGGNWDDWNNNTFGASDDGTFGSLSATVAAADTSVGTGSNQGTNLSLNRSVKPGSLTLTLTNNSGSDQRLEGFFFDGARRNQQSAPNWELTFSGAISGTAASGVLASGNMSSLSAAERNWAVDLTSLGDNLWEAGGDAVFTLSFSGGDAVPPGQSGGGQETLVDNIGVTVVPEPSGLSLLALGLSGLIIRRRK